MKKNIGILAAIIFFVLFVIYGGFETIKVVLGPSLIITSPKDLATVKDPLVLVRGSVKRAAFISINDRQIFADTNGDFAIELLLPAGYNIINVKVKDRFGKQVSKNLTLYYQEN